MLSETIETVAPELVFSLKSSRVFGLKSIRLNVSVIVDELGSLGFVSLRWSLRERERGVFPSHLGRPVIAAQVSDCDARLNRSMVNYIRTSWMMQDMHELETATREASLDMPEVD